VGQASLLVDVLLRAQANGFGGFGVKVSLRLLAGRGDGLTLRVVLAEPVVARL